eukprot:6985881-Pyramimonas_sp.AAC.4
MVPIGFGGCNSFGTLSVLKAATALCEYVSCRRQHQCDNFGKRNVLCKNGRIVALQDTLNRLCTKQPPTVPSASSETRSCAAYMRKVQEH